MRKRPRILICGTPGVGKSTLSAAVAEAGGLKHMNLGELIKEHGLTSEWDEEQRCWFYDEGRILDFLDFDEDEEGGIVLDFHSVDFFPKDWFDLVVVLRTETETLHDRLSARNYPQKKISENIECEIFRVVYDEALETFGETTIREFPNNTAEEMENAVQEIVRWATDFEPVD